MMEKTLLNRFIQYMRYEQNRSEATLVAYATDLEAYVAFARKQVGEDFEPGERDVDLVRGWMLNMLDQGQKATSVNRHLSAVKAFYRYLHRCGCITMNPVAELRGPKKEKPLPAYVSQRDMLRILDEPLEDEKDFVQVRDRLIVEMLYETGMRRAELSSLRDLDVDVAGCSLKVLGKGDKERIIPFGERLSGMIKKWRIIRDEKVGNPEFFFVSLRGRPMKAEEVYPVVYRFLQGVPNLSRRGPHTLRHSFATDLLNEGADLMAIKELLGHERISTTVQYTHTTFRQLQMMYNAHPRAQKSTTMEVRIQAIHFDATQQLEGFITKKVSKLDQFADDIQAADVILKVLKPETANNKEASVRLHVKGYDFFAEKVSDSFEAAVDATVEALRRQIRKRKDARDKEIRRNGE
ncbi:ribosome hibernation-promoting factor, HPF/YfiA family [Porphyromonas macacae]|uniref:ribosome hibernation-promoting factor, HPF/YfiA family n=1 Tax=Porphyromonas macacae TaxID=28115 RepID=UPI0024ADA9D2|nr:ribosome-associated translation inhibitor RaiA [Porphyromonas macacae]